MTPEALLGEMRDIEVPAEPGWWLLSPFWQSILILLLSLLAGWMIYRYRRKRQARLREARDRLARIRVDYRLHADSRATLQSLSAWLKQVAMAAFPEHRVGALTGRAWIEFLQQTTRARIFDAELQRLFGADVYRRNAELDLNPAIEACENWLAAIGERLRQRGDQHDSA